MKSQTSDPVYIPKDTLNAIEKWIETTNGKKLGISNPKKVVSYILTRFLEDQS